MCDSPLGELCAGWATSCLLPTHSDLIILHCLVLACGPGVPHPDQNSEHLPEPFAHPRRAIPRVCRLPTSPVSPYPAWKDRSLGRARASAQELRCAPTLGQARRHDLGAWAAGTSGRERPRDDWGVSLFTVGCSKSRVVYCTLFEEAQRIQLKKRISDTPPYLRPPCFRLYNYWRSSRYPCPLKGAWGWSMLFEGGGENV